MSESQMPKKQYAYWDEESGCPMLHDSMADAVSSSPDLHVEVYEVTFKLLGTYREKVSTVKVSKKSREVTL